METHKPPPLINPLHIPHLWKTPREKETNRRSPKQRHKFNVQKRGLEKIGKFFMQIKNRSEFFHQVQTKGLIEMKIRTKKVAPS